MISDVAEKVLESRYFRKDENGEVIEDWDGLVDRVSCAIGKAEMAYSTDDSSVSPVECRRVNFVAACKAWIGTLHFLPNSPTLMNAGLPDAQLSACFLLPVDDDVPSIFDTVKQMALIFKSGGGVGLPMSRLRPKGDMVKSTGGVSSGPVSFMRVYNTTAEVVAQGGRRRGALMGTLRVDHPDILEFVTTKRDLSQLTSFNMSVAVTDAFMNALRGDLPYDLINPRLGIPCSKISAREVWDAIVESAWCTGEPGLVFIDRINDAHAEITGIESGEKIEGTNPCGELPLLPYESCNLGSINLSLFVLNAYTAEAKVDCDKLREVTRFAVRFLDNTITVNNFPLPQIAEMTLKNRKIGLGVMGFAEMLIKLGIAYGSCDSIDVLYDVLGVIDEAAVETTLDLAKERGAFPNSPDGGRRNATLTAIAPTGSISMIAGVTGGIEPMFAVAMERRSILDGKPFMQVNETVIELLKHHDFDDDMIDSFTSRIAQGIPFNIAVEELGKECRYVLCAHEIPPETHVAMQAAAQKHIESAVSKTVNLPFEASQEAVDAIFDIAYDSGCKGITVYRDGCRANQPMSVAKPLSDVLKDAKDGDEVHLAAGVYEVAGEDKKKRHPIVDAVLNNPYVYDGEKTGAGHIEILNKNTTWEKVLACCVRLGINPPALLEKDKIKEDRPGLLKLHMKERPESLPGHTVKMKTGCGTLFVTVSTDEDGNPVELFAHHGKAGICSAAQCEAIGRLSSMSLRAGIDPQEIVGQLRGITCHEQAGMGPAKVLSCADGIAQAISKALKAAGEAQGKQFDDREETNYKATPVYMGSCPKCGSGTIREAGCVVCKTCGWEKCS